jgi:hypothetical protein
LTERLLGGLPEPRVVLDPAARPESAVPAGVLVFFGCLQGLHRQLLAARRYLEWAGRLYARLRADSVRLAGSSGRAGSGPAAGIITQLILIRFGRFVAAPEQYAV